MFWQFLLPGGTAHLFASLLESHNANQTDQLCRAETPLGMDIDTPKLEPDVLKHIFDVRRIPTDGADRVQRRPFIMSCELLECATSVIGIVDVVAAKDQFPDLLNF